MGNQKTSLFTAGPLWDLSLPQWQGADDIDDFLSWLDVTALIGHSTLIESEKKSRPKTEKVGGWAFDCERGWHRLRYRVDAEGEVAGESLIVSNQACD